MNKKLTKLTEGDLHRIVKESINMILSEWKNHRQQRKQIDRGVVAFVSEISHKIAEMYIEKNGPSPYGNESMVEDIYDDLSYQINRSILNVLQRF